MAHTANPPNPRVTPYVLGVEDKETGSLAGHVGLSGRSYSLLIYHRS